MPTVIIIQIQPWIQLKQSYVLSGEIKDRADSENTKWQIFHLMSWLI